MGSRRFQPTEAQPATLPQPRTGFTGVGPARDNHTAISYHKNRISTHAACSNSKPIVRPLRARRDFSGILFRRLKPTAIHGVPLRGTAKAIGVLMIPPGEGAGGGLSTPD